MGMPRLIVRTPASSGRTTSSSDLSPGVVTPASVPSAASGVAPLALASRYARHCFRTEARATARARHGGGRAQRHA